MSSVPDTSAPGTFQSSTLDQGHPNFRNPLDALNSFLSGNSQLQRLDVSHSSIEGQQRHCNPGTNIDEMLRLADFLFGNTLDGALSLLETDPKRDILRLTSLQSKRTMYIVKGRTSRSKGYSSLVTTDSSYLCMLPDTSLLSEEENFDHSIYYCSCRSFLERCRISSNGNATCKHLLALKLMPALGVDCSILETSSDEEYSKLALQRLNVE